MERELRRKSTWDSPSVRLVRRQHDSAFRSLRPDVAMELVRRLLVPGDWRYRMLAFELLAGHRAAFGTLTEPAVDGLAEGLADWGSVDLFGVTISGKAWRDQLVSDHLVVGWAHSSDRWKRRLALVSTVPLNSRSRGGVGDPGRTLMICDILASDHDPMLVKATSWALRELAKREPASALKFIQERETKLHSLVRREVRRKVATGRKNG
jgi:3-methyladenine DNA glycosylase AlkD